MGLFMAYRFDDKRDTTAPVGSIPVPSISNLSNTDIHRDCGSESLAHLYPKWAGERMIVLCRFCFSLMNIICNSSDLNWQY